MTTNISDILVLGSGMGGMTAATLLANEGWHVRVLEGDHLPGGSSSTYYRKGYRFETGATTLIGFDHGQPLERLEQMLDIRLPRQEISPSMAIMLDQKSLIRFKDRQKWMKEAGRFFGNPEGQKRFWETAFQVSDLIWRASARNPYFPPESLWEWWQLAVNNNPLEVPLLRYGLVSVQDVMKKCGIDTPLFRKFADEQLMITAQANAGETPFLFGAAGLTYPNYSNYYVPGGLLEMVRSLQEKLEAEGGELLCKKEVTFIAKAADNYRVHTQKGDIYTAPIVISNIPVWNMADLVDESMQPWFRKYAARYKHAWGAFTMGIATEDTFPDNMILHHQLHADQVIPNTESKSVFVSLSARGDTRRAPEGERTINVSTHVNPDWWFNLGDSYYERKKQTEIFILDFLNHKLTGFNRDNVKVAFSGTPVTWQNWIFRKKGRVGGIPQNMKRSLLDWTPAQTPFDGLYLTGDTVFPGQGIPGVTLSGINAFYRVLKYSLHTRSIPA